MITANGLESFASTENEDDAGHATIKQQLYDRLLQWIAETNDPRPATPTKAKDMYTT
jgi:hypothetical protein